MKKTNSKIILLTIPSIIFIGCDCHYDYKGEMKNETTENIRVEFKNQGQELKKINIEPNQTITLTTAKGFRCGCLNCEGERVNLVDSSMAHLMTAIRVFKNDSILSKTDFNNEYNWKFTTSKKVAVYLGRIDNTDF